MNFANILVRLECQSAEKKRETAALSEPKGTCQWENETERGCFYHLRRQKQ